MEYTYSSTIQNSIPDIEGSQYTKYFVIKNAEKKFIDLATERNVIVILGDSYRKLFYGCIEILSPPQDALKVLAKIDKIIDIQFYDKYKNFSMIDWISKEVVQFKQFKELINPQTTQPIYEFESEFIELEPYCGEQVLQYMKYPEKQFRFKNKTPFKKQDKPLSDNQSAAYQQLNLFNILQQNPSLQQLFIQNPQLLQLLIPSQTSQTKQSSMQSLQSLLSNMAQLQYQPQQQTYQQFQQINPYPYQNQIQNLVQQLKIQYGTQNSQLLNALYTYNPNARIQQQLLSEGFYKMLQDVIEKTIEKELEQQDEKKHKKHYDLNSDSSDIIVQNTLKKLKPKYQRNQARNSNYRSYSKERRQRRRSYSQSSSISIDRRRNSRIMSDKNKYKRYRSRSRSSSQRRKHRKSLSNSKKEKRYRKRQRSNSNKKNRKSQGGLRIRDSSFDIKFQKKNNPENFIRRSQSPGQLFNKLVKKRANYSSSKKYYKPTSSNTKQTKKIELLDKIQKPDKRKIILNQKVITIHKRNIPDILQKIKKD